MDVKPSKAFSSIKQGLSEALEFSEGIESKAVIRKLTAAKTKERLEADVERKEDAQITLSGTTIIIPCNFRRYQSLKKPLMTQ